MADVLKGIGQHTWVEPETPALTMPDVVDNESEVLCFAWIRVADDSLTNAKAVVKPSRSKHERDFQSQMKIQEGNHNFIKSR